MKTIMPFILCVIILIFGACNTKKTEITDKQIVVGTIKSIHSEILNEERNILIHFPDKGIWFQQQKLPVVYLLDGEAYFSSVVGMIQVLSQANVLPQMIVVGITNTDRFRDLSPSHVKSIPPVLNDSVLLTTTGGAENFTSFIEKELIPYVDSLYPTAPYRLLIGHSLGGLFAINTLINHTPLFNGYIAIDPSLDWDNKKLLQQAKQAIKERDFEGTSLFFAIASSTDEKIDTLKVRTDTSAITSGIRSNIEFGSIVDANKQNRLKSYWKYYKDDSHTSVPLIAVYDGLRFIFDYYFLAPKAAQVLDPSFRYDSLLKMHFEKVSQNIGYKILPTESLVNMFAYEFLLYKQFDKAFSLFKMNIENYPTSANVYDSMGELLITMGDTLNAIENYEKSLKLNPQNENAKTIIRRMKE